MAKAKTRSGLIAALDVGSSKVCCFVAKADGETLRVVGIGHQVSKGVRSGTIVDMADAEHAIRAAVDAAEQMAGQTIGEVVVTLSGGQPQSRTIGVEVAISGHEVGDADLRRVLDQANHITLPPDRELIHSLPVGFTIDGSRGIRDPRGMYGDRLGVNMHLITAGAGPIRNLQTCVARCHLDIEDLVVAPFASGLACLVEDETELGVTLIDMGGGTTSIAVFCEGEVVHTDMIPVGGQHVTNDIARGLSTTVAHAERMKTLYGSTIPSANDDREILKVPLVGEEDDANANQVPRSMLVGIIQPRMEETFELVRQRLEASGFDKVAGRRVVVTGGASQLQGARELAALILDKQVRMGRPMRIHGLAEATNGPAFSTGAGLLAYALNRPAETRASAKRPAEEPSSRLGRLGLWFRENF